MDNPPPGFYDKVARLSALLDEIKPTSA
jgi:hypothetical protein